MTDRKAPSPIAVITGGTGFIGAHLANELARRDYAVRVIDIAPDARRRLHSPVKLIRGDIRQKADLEEAFSGARYVFHCAALPRVQQSIDEPDETHETNVTGTLNVLIAARDAGVKKVVFSSSSAVYGDQEQMPLHESIPPSPKSPYALHKLIGEQYCRLFSEIYALPTVSLRYFNVYGPGGDPEGPYALVISRFLDRRARGEDLTITGDGTQTRDFVHVRDVVRANFLAAESERVGKGEALNIGSGKSVSVNRIAELIGGPTRYIKARLEPHDTLAESSFAKKLLGWEPTTALEEGIAELKKLAGL
ncbi:MAG TPA: NAD-dependent epimerase/dehydratase family protein [Candidatus Paceibacterota bacterium]|nr:NAD-dependent epimerase/dehydratase family protein [Candidatus Paceibacterota bacterium]